jgi:hypothetical protein
MADVHPTDSWSKALSLYDSLSGSGWSHIPAFRSLVYAIATADEARGLTAITSHEVLTISPHTRYPDWFEGRRVQLHPLSDGNVRVVKYSDRDNQTWSLPLDEARVKVVALLSEL